MKSTNGKINTEQADGVFMYLAKMAAMKSTCRKKQLGCVLVLEDHRHVCGTNGPPFPLKPCEPCPRLNSHSCTNTEVCRSVHAERQCLLLAAKYGYSTHRAKLYSFMGVPCKNCLLELIQAGVREIVCIKETYYDEMSKDILAEWIKAGGVFRIYKIEEEK